MIEEYCLWMRDNLLSRNDEMGVTSNKKDNHVESTNISHINRVATPISLNFFLLLDATALQHLAPSSLGATPQSSHLQ